MKFLITLRIKKNFHDSKNGTFFTDNYSLNLLGFRLYQTNHLNATAHANTAILIYQILLSRIASFNRIQSCAISIIFNNIHISVAYHFPITSYPLVTLIVFFIILFITSWSVVILSLHISNKYDVSTTNPRGGSHLYNSV